MIPTITRLCNDSDYVPKCYRYAMNQSDLCTARGFQMREEEMSQTGFPTQLLVIEAMPAAIWILTEQPILAGCRA
jgi:hypothetical protein